jgi:hypothetical protein
VTKRNLLHEFTSKYRQVYYDETDTCGVIMRLVHGSLRNNLSTTAVTSFSRHNTDTQGYEKNNLKFQTVSGLECEFFTEIK